MTRNSAVPDRPALVALLIAAASGPVSASGAPASAAGSDRWVFLPLRGDRDAACARVLAEAAEELGREAEVARAAAPPSSGPWARFEPFLNRARARAGADVVTYGAIRADRIVLEAYAGEPLRLLGLREVRTAGRCGLTPRGYEALQEFMTMVEQRRRGQHPFDVEEGSSIPRSPRVPTPDFGPGPRSDSRDRPAPSGSVPSTEDSTTVPRPEPAGESSEAAGRVGSPVASIRLFLGLARRDFELTDIRDPSLLGMRSPAAFFPGVGLGLWPFRGWAPAVLDGFELRGTHHRALGLRAAVEGAASEPVIHTESMGEVAWHIPVRTGLSLPLSVAPRGGLHRLVARLEGATSLNLPEVEHVSMSVGAELAARALDRLAVRLGGSYLALLSSGALTRSGAFEGARVEGLKLDGQLDFLFDQWSLGVELVFLAYGAESLSGARADDQHLRFGTTVTARF